MGRAPFGALESESDWLGWTETDYIQLVIILGWPHDDPRRQGLEDSNEFYAIVLYCTRTKSA